MALLPEMPSISSLPVEIRTSILRFVGSRQLHDKLTVCKWWYNIAHCLVYEDIEFSEDTLLRFPLASDVVRDSIRRNVRSLSVELNGRHYTDVSLLLSLRLLADTLRSCAKLSVLHFRARTAFDQDNQWACRWDTRCLGLSSVVAFTRSLPYGSLTRLNIDTSGTCSSPPRSLPDNHLCPYIARRLPALRYLCLKMRYICPAVLSWDPANGSSALQSVIINLYIIGPDGPDGPVTSLGFAKHCDATPGGSVCELRASMSQAASALAIHSPGLNMMRLIYHTVPRLVLIADDCITGKTVRIPYGNWEDDGETEDEESEQTDNCLFDSDNSSWDSESD